MSGPAVFAALALLGLCCVLAGFAARAASVARDEARSAARAAKRAEERVGYQLPEGADRWGRDPETARRVADGMTRQSGPGYREGWPLVTDEAGRPVGRAAPLEGRPPRAGSPR